MAKTTVPWTALEALCSGNKPVGSYPLTEAQADNYSD